MCSCSFSGEIKYMTVRINDSVDTDAYSHFTDVVDFVGKQKLVSDF